MTDETRQTPAETMSHAVSHTPGPWSIETPLGDETPWIVEDGKQPHEWRCIAMVCTDDPINDEDRDPVAPILPREMQANARLIAAAPDMLAALIKTRDNVAGLSKSNDDVFAAMVRRIEAAIAKATGQLTNSHRPEGK